MKDRKKMKRGAVRQSDCVFVGAWMPVPMVTAIDAAVETLDLDRSKFLRRAVEEKIAAKEAA
jgi:hypothetical protein